MSRIWFSGSRNSNKTKSIMTDHQVTLENVFGGGHMAKWSINIISGCINATEVIRVSRIWFSGSRNPNKVQLIMSGHHVTLNAYLVKVT